MKASLVRFWKEEEGLTATEYAVAGALVAGACVTAFTNLGTSISNFINFLAGKIVTP